MHIPSYLGYLPVVTSGGQKGSCRTKKERRSTQIYSIGYLVFYLPGILTY